MLNLELFKTGYPRAYFFRLSETGMPAGKYSLEDLEKYFSQFSANNYPFEEWEKIFIRLGGIQGKVLEEEIPGRSKNIPFFTQYKKRHPEKLVLLHYNGNARDPRDHGDRFFAGHWIYFNGCRITKDVPAEEGESEISVEDPTLFRVNIGRYKDKNEDIGLCLLDAEGKPDWHHSEQVQLLSTDHTRKVIRVRRGCFGTKPMALPANKSYAAAHATEGPWGKVCNLMWFYNYSTACPRDAQGRTCVDILVDDVASHFVLGGDLECFDGLEFDVLRHGYPSTSKDRGLDMDGDGRVDNGWVDGVNIYGIGIYEFCRRLRRKLGEDRIIQADGMALVNQRCFGVLNGIESEGWPIGSDMEVEDWSGGINRHFFWNQNARRPVFNYINYRWWRTPAPPLNITRLVLAAGQFIDAPICGIDHPEAEPGEAIGIWDELRMGIEHRTGWLGFPLGPAVRLALQTKDLLKGAGEEMKPQFAKRFEGENVKFTVEDRSLCVSAGTQVKGPLAFKLRNVPCQGPDLFVSLKIRASEMKDYPIDIPRFVWVGLSVEGEKGKSATAGTGEWISSKPMRFLTWANPNWFEASFYFRKVQSERADLEFEAERCEPVWLKDVSVYAHPDAIIREFENGLVLANPSLHEYTFDLDALTPRKKYRRLIGSSRQDPKTNDGSPVEGKVTLGPRDGLFLIRTD